MPEEIEVPTEHLQETIEHHAHKAHDAHGGHGAGATAGHGAPGGHTAESASRWIQAVALSSALIAVLAAISALLGGHYSNEAMLEQIEASDKYAYYQAKGIKSSVLETRDALLLALGRPVGAGDAAKIEDYKREQTEIKAEADTLVLASQKHLARHNVLARAVTLFQIAVALAAMAVLTRRRELWYGSIGLGLIASGFLIQSFL